MKIEIRTPDRSEIEGSGILNWPIWEKEVSEFLWHYDSEETCLIIEGEVIVTTESGESVGFGAGDLVIFPKGLSCTWKIKKAVRKHYNFR